MSLFFLEKTPNSKTGNGVPTSSSKAKGGANQSNMPWGQFFSRQDKLLDYLQVSLNKNPTIEDFAELLAAKSSKAQKDRAEGKINRDKLEGLKRAAEDSLEKFEIPDIDALIALFQKQEEVRISETDLTTLLKTPVEKLNIKNAEMQIAGVLAKLADTGAD